MNARFLKWTRIVLVTSIFLFTLVGANFFLLSHTQSAHAASLQSQPASASLTPVKMQAIIEKASQYIHIVNGTAIIDPAIRAHLDAQDVAIVQTLVAHYNALPLSQKLPLSVSGTSHTTSGAIPYAFGCNQYMYVSHPWWGTRVYLNHCTIITVAGLGLVGLFGAIASQLALLGIIIGAYVGALVLADQNCSNQGAFLDNYFGTAWWVNGVC